MKSVTQGLEEPRSHDETAPRFIEVNHNGLMLLAWFRSLPDDEQSGVVRIVGEVAAKARH